MQACQVTVWVEDAQGKKRASHSICATLKPDGSREYRLDSRVKSGKDVKVQLFHAAVPFRSAAACLKGLSPILKHDNDVLLKFLPV